MNNYPLQDSADAMRTPAQTPFPEQPRKNPKSANYFEYRCIPQEAGMPVEPLEDSPDVITERVHCPIFKQIETVQVSAPIPETSNFFDGVNPSLREAFGVNGSLHLSRGPVERIVRTSYRVLTPEVQEPSIIVYQNHSPPESFFQEVRPVSIVTSVQTPARVSYRAPHFETSNYHNAEIHKRFHIINALNRIESDTKALAIKQRRIEVMGHAQLRNSGVFVDEAGMIMHQLADFKLELNGLEDDVNRLGGIDISEKIRILNRVNEVRVQIDNTMKATPMAETTVGLRTSNILLNESLVSTSSGKRIRVSVEPGLRRPGSVSRVVTAEPRVVRYVNHPMVDNSRPIVTNDAIHTTYLPMNNVIIPHQTLAAPTIEYNDLRKSHDQFYTDANPRVIRYSYNPSTYVSNITTTQRVTQTVEHPSHVTVRGTQFTHPMSDIRESINENSYKSSVYQQNLVTPGGNVDSRRRVTVGMTNSLSGRDILVDERIVLATPIPSKSIERKSLGSVNRVYVLSDSLRSSQHSEVLQPSSNRQIHLVL
jgi:hypothetical protein